MSKKEKKWFNARFEFDNDLPIRKNNESEKTAATATFSPQKPGSKLHFNTSNKNWMKNFDPITPEDLAVNSKKVQEIEHWLKLMSERNQAEVLLLTGPVGCGKTITIQTLAAKHKLKVSEWVTPLDIDIPTEYGDYEFKERQSTKFLDFIISAANFTSLLDNNTRKIVLVEDFPHTFMRTPSEFTEILDQYKRRAKSPIVFICSESHSDNKNTAMNLFTPQLKDQFQIQHIPVKTLDGMTAWEGLLGLDGCRWLWTGRAGDRLERPMFSSGQIQAEMMMKTLEVLRLNGVTVTGLKSALKRVAEIISKKYSAVYRTPTADLIDCVVNSSGGDVRSAVLNLHFACLKGSNQVLETSKFMEKDKSKGKIIKKKKQLSTKFSSIGKDQTVSILHGVGRVLNPKMITEDEKQKLSHAPADVIEQFTSQPTSFVNFLEENYLPHFSCIEHAQRAACALSDADVMLAEWRDRLCQEYGLYVATAGLMLANKAPVSAWNPVRGPKNMNIKYPTLSELPLLDPDCLYKGKVLVSDFQTYCKIINSASS